MENNQDLNELEQKLIDQLEYIKEGYIKMKQDSLFTIRKDIVSASLKDIIANSDSLEEIKTKLNDFIDTLLKPEDFIIQNSERNE